MFTKRNDIALPQFCKNQGTFLDIYSWLEEKEQFHACDHSSLKCIYSFHSPPQHSISELAMVFPGQHESHAAVDVLGHTCWLLEN